MSAARPQGLRERKKASTRAMIRATALRLFREHGYDATTVEQIADTAEVSTSTAFRYFPTKESLVIDDRDEGDDLAALVAAARDRPRAEDPVRVLRAALAATTEGLSPTELQARRDRQLLVLTVPQLWAAGLPGFRRSLDTLAELVAEHGGGSADDPAVRTRAGVLLGVLTGTWMDWARRPDGDPFQALDEALARLEG